MEFYNVLLSANAMHAPEQKDDNIMSEKSKRFKYNKELEWALCNLLGSKYCNLAGGYSSVKYCKKDLRRAIKHIKKRLNKIITIDERLLSETSILLERLDNYIKGTSIKVNNDWYIIAILLNLISLLIGYDWKDGKVYRHIIYYQDKEQERTNYIKEVGNIAFWEEFGGDKRIRYEIVYLLNEKKLPKNQIARVLGLNYNRINKILKAIEDFEKSTGEKFLKHYI
jgi:hypothetical protein